MIICVCKAVGERTLRDAIRAGARSIAELARQTGASTDCGTCIGRLGELLAEELAPSPPFPAPGRGAAPNPEVA